jgi:hypothetical protein
MNSLTILTVMAIGASIYFAFRLGQESGYDNGYCEGRKAVRKYYEQVSK